MSSTITQTIHLSGQIDSDPIPLTSSSVSVHCSKQPTTPPQTGSSLQVKSEASNRVQIQNLANQQWDLKRLTDNLICENESYLAYILHGKSGCIVRLMHKQSEQRQLIKSFTWALSLIWCSYMLMIVSWAVRHSNCLVNLWAKLGFYR